MAVCTAAVRPPVNHGGALCEERRSAGEMMEKCEHGRGGRVMDDDD